MRSGRCDTPLRVPGCPIRTSTDRSSVDSSPWHIAVAHVLLRLQAPRHPPLALSSLENKDARARSGILKGRDGTRRASQPQLTTAGDGRVRGGRPQSSRARRRHRRRGTRGSLPQNGRAGSPVVTASSIRRRTGSQPPASVRKSVERPLSGVGGGPPESADGQDTE
jgi:hypothetical protein